jgi:molybdate/tungstate transport system substrate-binding protein
MKCNNNRWTCLLLGFLILSLVSMGCLSQQESTPADETPVEEAVTLKVFHAGSLTSPLEKIKAEFERDYPHVTVQLEPAGSVKCVNKITEIGLQADVLASADYSLIPSMMVPDYAEWYLTFAKNEMVLTYSDDSAYADQITENNWYEILQEDGVIWGFSNPNLDPCGYRTPMVIQLSELYYGDDQIFEKLITSQTAITVSEEEGVYKISTPEDLSPNSQKVVIRDKSVDLVSMVQSGGLDYAWEYLSVAKQNDLHYISLSDAINLSSVDQTDTYKRVQVMTCDAKTKTGKPIVYGITVPLNAPQPELGALFVEYVINETGQHIFENDGQPPIVPAVAYEIEQVPDNLAAYIIDVQERES